MKTIKLTKGKVALVDDADYEWLLEYNWHAHRTEWDWYARGRKKGSKRKVYMHRVILGLTDRTQEGDHKDGDGLNNQRHNLRSANHSQNLGNRHKTVLNTSGYKGVWWNKLRNKWISHIQTKHLGSFTTREAAARAYDRAAVKLYGEFARVNFPQGNQACGR